MDESKVPGFFYGPRCISYYYVCACL